MSLGNGSIFLVTWVDNSLLGSLEFAPGDSSLNKIERINLQDDIIVLKHTLTFNLLILIVKTLQTA